MTNIRGVNSRQTQGETVVTARGRHFAVCGRCVSTVPRSSAIMPAQPNRARQVSKRHGRADLAAWPNEPMRWRSEPLDAPAEDDFGQLCAALSAKRARPRVPGRRSTPRRNRETPTPRRARGDRAARGSPARRRLRRASACVTICACCWSRSARAPEIAAPGPAARAAKLGKLLDLLERRIDAVAEAKAADTAPSHCRGCLDRIKPNPPIPSPTSPSRPAILVPLPVSRPPIAAPRRPSAAEKAAVQPPRRAPDPLAAIMALSEDRAPGAVYLSRPPGRRRASARCSNHVAAARGCPPSRRMSESRLAINFANKSASTLPPESTPTTTLPLDVELAGEQRGEPDGAARLHHQLQFAERIAHRGGRPRRRSR